MTATTGIGVDIGGSHIVCCGVDLRSDELIDGTRFELKLNRKATKEDLFLAWAEPINQTISALGDTAGAGIGFAMPGSFNYKTGVALFTGNDKYEHLYGVDVRKEFVRYLAVDQPTMRFINDATAFGIGTAYLDRQNEVEKLIAITLGTGFGSTFNEGGTPAMQGENVPPHGSLWHLPLKEGIADDYFSTRWFVNAYRELTGRTVAGAKEVAEAAIFDDQVRGLFEAFGTNLADFLAPWLAGFGADKLVVGGNIARSWYLIEPAFRQALAGKHPQLKIQSSTHMEAAALLGSGKLLDDTFWNQVKDDLPER